MKIICSNGGPLVGLSREYAHLWCGNEGKDFIGKTSPFSTDYDAACEFTGGQHYPPTNIAKLPGSVLDALLITLPIETAVVGADQTSVSIAQVEAADPDWLFSDISGVDYQKANFTKKAILETQSCVFVIFDAAYRFKDVGAEFLSFEIQQGKYQLLDAIYSKNNRTDLFLIKLIKTVR